MLFPSVQLVKGAVLGGTMGCGSICHQEKWYHDLCPWHLLNVKDRCEGTDGNVPQLRLLSCGMVTSAHFGLSKFCKFL
jgi:hypothetical protein